MELGGGYSNKHERGNKEGVDAGLEKEAAWPATLLRGCRKGAGGHGDPGLEGSEKSRKEPSRQLVHSYSEHLHMSP